VEKEVVGEFIGVDGFGECGTQKEGQKPDKNGQNKFKTCENVVESG